MDTKVMETQRLYLKKMYPEDFEFMFQNQTKEEIMKTLGHETDVDYLKEKEKAERGYIKFRKKFVYFQMILKDTNQIIGYCTIHNIVEEHNRAEIGYALNNDMHKRKGYTSEALEYVLKYGFEKLKLFRIEALIAAENTASLKLLLKNNFKFEGTIRGHYLVNGIQEDSLQYSLLATD